MRDVFVGSLCAIALFLLFYRAYSWDYIVGCLAGVFALGIALFPTTPDVNVTPRDKFIGTLHIIFAASFLLTLAFISLVLFRKTDPTRTPTRRKLQRNVIYTVCGYTILACLALIVVVAFLGKDSPVKKLSPVFWLEAAAVVAFGVSWLTKGEAMLKDETQT